MVALAQKPAMQVIDGKWLKAQFTGEHGEQVRLAEAVGLTPDKITKILNLKRTIRPHEAPAFLAYFANKASGSGFEEPVESFKGQVAVPSTPAPGIVDLLCKLAPSARNPTFYRMARSETGAALLAGDWLVIELGANAQSGDLVLVTKLDPHTDRHQTVLRRYLPPHLLPLDTLTPPESSASTLESAIVAVIKASARPGL